MSTGNLDEPMFAETIEQLTALAIEMGWLTLDEFCEEVGLAPEEILGRPFDVVHNRLFFL